MDMTEIRRLEEQKVGTLKLSEAIRIGARIRPQCRDSLFFDGRSCAVGAAFEAITGLHDNNSYNGADIVKACGTTFSMLADVARMNDEEGMTREQIADRLESQGL